MNEIPNEMKLGIIRIKLQQWNNTLYDISLDERVGQVTKNDNLVKDASDRMKMALMAIDELKIIQKDIEARIGKVEKSTKEA